MSGRRKRSVAIRGHRTSISLEAPFWDALSEIAALEGRSVAGLIAAIDASRGAANLSSAIRCHVLAHYRQRGGTSRIGGPAG